MIDHILKQSYPALIPATESAMRGIHTGLVTRIANALGIYSGDLRIVPMLQGSTEPCYRVFSSQGNLSARWMDNIEAHFRNDSSWITQRNNSPAPNPTPVIRDTARNTIMFVYGNYAIEMTPISNDHESVALYRGYGQIGRVHTEMFRAMGLDYDENGWYLPVVVNGVEIDRTKIGSYLSEALYATGINSNRYSSNNYAPAIAYRNLVNSKYFSKQIFTEEVRARLADCKFFQDLIASPQWAEAEDKHDFNSNSAPWVTYLKKSYAHYIVQVEATVRRAKRKGMIDAKFSNELITEVTGITSVNEIKGFRAKMNKAFKSSWELEEFILSSDIHAIRSKMAEVNEGTAKEFSQIEYDMESSFARSLPKEMLVNLDPNEIHESHGFKYRITHIQNSNTVRNPRIVVNVEFTDTPPAYRNILLGASRAYVTTDYSVYYTG